MKNYVVWHNCRIEEHERHFGIEPAAAPGVAGRYDLMHQVSLASARHYLAGTWEPLVFTDSHESRVAMFQHSWQRIRDLWHSEPCNILYLDSDTVFVKPTEIFDQHNNFRMFNWSMPHSKPPFEHYFNAAVRYYPAVMSRDVWDIGDNLAMTWDLNIWDQEQIIFNHMLWTQNVKFSDVHQPQLNWQAPTGNNSKELTAWNDYNTVPLHQAQIIHYHGTRSSNRGVELAMKLAQEAGVPL